MDLVTEEQIINTLQKYNVWWRNISAVSADSKPQKRLAYYEAKRILGHDSVRRFVVLSGARRVGKTTIMYQLIDHLMEEGVPPRNILYVSFDNPMIKPVDNERVLDIYESLYPVEGPKYVFLDEIQYSENWELWMKVVYDSRKDIRLVATGSASPVLEKGAADSGTGRWTVLKIPTLSFYEYCKLLELDAAKELTEQIRLTELVRWKEGRLLELSNRFGPLSKDDIYSQRMLREDVVDKVIKRDVLTLFNIRSPLLMEKLFLYLCINSTEIFNVTTAAKELENTSMPTIESYIAALEMSNLIYLAKPMDVGSKGALKGKPKIMIADAAIRNAVLMIDDVLSDEKELGMMVETAVYKHMVSFYQGSTARLGYFRKAKDNQKEVDVVVVLFANCRERSSSVR